MCPILRSKFLGHLVEFTHFTAEAGKVDCFGARHLAGFWFIDAVDSDEARYLIDRYPQSISQPKKSQEVRSETSSVLASQRGARGGDTSQSHPSHPSTSRTR
jgi:hypothetical protein